jgi:predicted glycosyltransferase
VLDYLRDELGHPLVVEHQAQVKGDVGHTWADTRRAKVELGWSPTVGLAEGLTGPGCFGPGCLARGASRMSAAPVKVLTYSHDGYGLGHLRRTLALLTELTRLVPEASVLSATGSPAASRFSYPPAVDYLKLPALTKDSAGAYVADILDLPVAQLIELRASVLEAMAGAYQPHLALIDFYPLGVHEELARALRRMRRGGDTHLVLGLRDILDEPANVRSQWREKGHIQAVGDLYDDVLVYGDQRVYDPVVEYGLTDDIAAKLIFTGYLVPERKRPQPSPQTAADGRRSAVCTVGGGKDAAPTAWAFLGAVTEELPPEWDGLLVTGPLMEAPEVTRLKSAATGTRVTVVEFLPDVAGARGRRCRGMHGRVQHAVRRDGGRDANCGCSAGASAIGATIAGRSIRRARRPRRRPPRRFEPQSPGVGDAGPGIARPVGDRGGGGGRICGRRPPGRLTGTGRDAAGENRGPAGRGGIMTFLQQQGRPATGASSASSARSVAVLVKRFPRLSETFILHEVLELRRQGLAVRIVAVMDPKESVVHPEAAALVSEVRYLCDSDGALSAVTRAASTIRRHPRGVMRALWWCLGRRSWAA